MMKFKIKKTKACLSARQGFTLIEMLLSVALIGLLAGISVPVYQSVQFRNDLAVGSNIIARSLRRAQTLSRATSQDIEWGVHIQSGSITIFQGTDYANRDSSFDEYFELSPSINPSGLGEIIFDKLTGNPQSTGNITLNSSSGETKNITINEKGTIDY